MNIKQGDIGSFKDAWGMVHKGCVVIEINEYGDQYNDNDYDEIPDHVLIYNPSFQAFHCIYEECNNFTKTNGEQDTKTRKMNFDYAVQHSGNSKWEWQEEEVKEPV